MTKHMHVVQSAIAISLCCTLTGCLDAGEEAETGSAEQAIFQNEVRVREIYASVLEEGGDEIYMNASQSAGGSINVIRPPGDPDYWRFDDPATAHFMNQHVGTIVSGSLLIVNLWEQDGGPHDEIGTIDFGFNNAGKPRTYDTPTGQFLGVNNDGLWVVRFTNGARYYVYFQIGQ
jgi:hypothetical protein